MSGQGLVDLGVPVGSIAYHASFQKHPIGLFADAIVSLSSLLSLLPPSPMLSPLLLTLPLLSINVL